jgi:hypothetical protein
MCEKGVESSVNSYACQGKTQIVVVQQQDVGIAL